VPEVLGKHDLGELLRLFHYESKACIKATGSKYVIWIQMD
jgi:hypothetical protein